MKIKKNNKKKLVPSRQRVFYNPERDGVTFSVLSTFLDCRYKARFYLQGWTSNQYSFALVFGSITHKILEWAYDEYRHHVITGPPNTKWVVRKLKKVEQLWRKENLHPTQTMLDHLELTLLMLDGVLPMYFRYWKGDFDNTLKWERVETIFKIPFTVTTRTGHVLKTFLRGKVDGSFRRKKRIHMSRPWLFETKTKSQINDAILADILPFDTQSNIYMGALRILDSTVPSGLLYNIIRRPALKRKVKETIPVFAARIKDDVAKRLDFYFVRMEVSVGRDEMNSFQGGLKEMVSDFLLWWRGEAGHYRNTNHCQNKFGQCQFIGLCLRGEKSGYHKRKALFPELENI